MNEITDSFRLCIGCGLKITSGEPVQPSRHTPANTIRSPKDKRKAPFGDPIAEIRVLFDALDVIVESPLADVVEVAKVVFLFTLALACGINSVSRRQLEGVKAAHVITYRYQKGGKSWFYADKVTRVDSEKV